MEDLATPIDYNNGAFQRLSKQVREQQEVVQVFSDRFLKLVGEKVGSPRKQSRKSVKQN